MHKYKKYNLLLFYVILIAPISIILFLYGFFPIASHDDAIASRLDIPNRIGNVSIGERIHTLYKPMIVRLIIMVIDGLRWDFIAGPTGNAAMPVTSKLLANSSGCLLRVKLQSPTVTMPRIKAMMTGTVPNFVDIVLNFGSKPLHSDNLLLQAKNKGHKLIFYGDDTWLSLFPDMFERHDGTTSFFVTDFTEVDNNVTRHVGQELDSYDWSMLILHYLGLDHIGHVEGPFGPSIKPKLQEMDEIIDQIARRVQYWNANRIRTLFVICGDHGMKDSGGHGGSTPQETTVPFVTIGQTRCSRRKDGEPVEIEQLDIAATLSTIYGLPIPFGNLGSSFVDSIYELDDMKRLFLLHYNSKQVLDRFRKLVDQESQIEYVHQKYLNTVNLHAAWLKTFDRSSEMTRMIVSSYNDILEEMKAVLISRIVEYDFRPMALAVFFQCQILAIMFCARNVAWTMHKRSVSFFLVYFFFFLGIYYLYNSESVTLLHRTSIFNALLVLLIVSILYINCDLCVNCDLSLKELLKRPRIRGVFEVGGLLHIVSLAGSSFVEEEHQTWYFFWCSAISYFLYRYSRKLLGYDPCDSTSANLRVQTEVDRHGYENSRRPRHVELCAKLLLLLIGHRVLRKLNSTGDKWAHLSDIARWLKEDDSKIGMTLLLLTALALLIWIAHECEDEEYRLRSLMLDTAVAACIYLRHMTNNAVLRIPLYFSSSGIYEVQTFWGIMMLFLLSFVYRVTSIIRRDKQRFAKTMLFFIINFWVMLSAMLHQPYNVILLPLQIIASSMIDAALKENDLTLELGVFVHCWLGNVFYFYQGNSNSLASINIAAGYVGLRSYMPFVTGAYLIVNTYSAPVLAYFLLVYRQQFSETHETIDIVGRTSRTYIAWRLLTMTVYMIIVAGQRHHLFVWSVFSPKLLYEATYSATMCCCVLVALIVITFQAAITPSCALYKD
ncbi:GPI ethanolamine phosphate transferase 2 [Nylanderia fulva]|uniref:GPI ethanolamine phosphate transferase 2 n=1 Tax=Nylanderia fulva TaxID=613905 RepID=UPI0010FAFF8E|nr:GPI ethanolamine phosphate transferase 2 [Nylanderia fulva]